MAMLLEEHKEVIRLRDKLEGGGRMEDQRKLFEN
jgi:hypothetical protein